MLKSSLPATSSSSPSSSQSKNSKAVALSPVTVQNLSSADRSKPVIEQFPPATIRGAPIYGKVPKLKQLTPSDTSLSKISELFSTSKIMNDLIIFKIPKAKRLVFEPTKRISLSFAIFRAPTEIATISLLVLRNFILKY